MTSTFEEFQTLPYITKSGYEAKYLCVKYWFGTFFWGWSWSQKLFVIKFEQNLLNSWSRIFRTYIGNCKKSSCFEVNSKIEFDQRFVSSRGNMEVLFSHTHSIVFALAYFWFLIILFIHKMPLFLVL